MWLVANVSSGQVFSPDLTPTARRRGVIFNLRTWKNRRRRERKKKKIGKTAYLSPPDVRITCISHTAKKKRFYKKFFCIEVLKNYFVFFLIQTDSVVKMFSENYYMYSIPFCVINYIEQAKPVRPVVPSSRQVRQQTITYQLVYCTFFLTLLFCCNRSDNNNIFEKQTKKKNLSLFKLIFLCYFR
jgi:hypothetical protein